MELRAVTTANTLCEDDLVISDKPRHGDGIMDGPAILALVNELLDEPLPADLCTPGGHHVVIAHSALSDHIFKHLSGWWGY